MNNIHPSSIIHENAELGDNITIGPFCTVGEGVVLGDGCGLISHAVINGPTTMGKNNTVHRSINGAPIRSRRYGAW